MEDVGIICSRLVNFPAIWYILWSSGQFSGDLVYFMANWYDILRKIWQP
jgi:hypothetical protein